MNKNGANCVRRKKGDPERAEGFLDDSLRSYVAEGWSLQVTHTRKQMAECQKLLQQTEEYPLKMQRSKQLGTQKSPTSEFSAFKTTGNSGGGQIILNGHPTRELEPLSRALT